jgi:hypothetical protein
MFLVTVRPPEPRWLVAVLRDPRASDRGWQAKRPNAEPIRDIDSLRDKLRFVTGAGITAKAGALGMSLQTPRVLVDADVALLSGAKPPATSAKSNPAAKSATQEKRGASVAPAGVAIADALGHAARGEWPAALSALLDNWRRSPRRSVSSYGGFNNAADETRAQTIRLVNLLAQAAKSPIRGDDSRDAPPRPRLVELCRQIKSIGTRGRRRHDRLARQLGAADRARPARRDRRDRATAPDAGHARQATARQSRAAANRAATQFSTNALSRLLRLGWRSLRSAFASI